MIQKANLDKEHETIVDYSKFSFHEFVFTFHYGESDAALNRLDRLRLFRNGV